MVATSENKTKRALRVISEGGPDKDASVNKAQFHYFPFAAVKFKYRSDQHFLKKIFAYSMINLNLNLNLNLILNLNLFTKQNTKLIESECTI